MNHGAVYPGVKNFHFRESSELTYLIGYKQQNKFIEPVSMH